jgi:hypothetical protein
MIAAMSQPNRREKDSGANRPRPVVLLFLAACLLATSPARAASREAASREAKERTARMACLSGDYAKGVAILSELFINTKDSTYIYNSARCFQQNAKFVEAAARFEEYLRVSKKLTEQEKAETQKQISDCQAALARQSGQTTPAAPAAQATPLAAAPTTTQGVVAPAPPVADRPVVIEQAEQATNSAPTAASGSGLRTAGIVTAAVGGVALLAGVILNLKVNSMANDFQNLNGYTDSKESDRKNFQTIGWVSYGVGAACVATGSVLYILGLRGGKQDATSMTFLPAFGPNGAAAIVKGSF